MTNLANAGVRILIAEDMMVVRQLMRDVLFKNGFKHVFLADDGAMAWSKIQDSHKENMHFDLILCDWNMPNISGIELLKMLRAHEVEVIRKTPFVMITTNNEKHQVIEALSLGANNFVIKPFDSEVLLKKIELVLGKDIYGSVISDR
jgi:two-component system chemotaxis response regulator CheY